MKSQKLGGLITLTHKIALMQKKISLKTLIKLFLMFWLGLSWAILCRMPTCMTILGLAVLI